MEQGVYNNRESTARKSGKPPVTEQADNLSKHQGKGLDHK